MDALCRLGADADALNPVRGNFTPLQMHLYLCHLQLGVEPNPELMRTLITHGADMAARNGRGNYSALSKLFWLVEASRETIPRPTSGGLHPNSLCFNSEFEVRIYFCYFFFFSNSSHASNDLCNIELRDMEGM